MLKRILLIAFCCAFTLFSITGCAGNAPEKDNSENTDKDEKINKSRQYAEEMATGEFENTVKEFDSTMTSLLTKEALEQSWADTTKNIGKYKSIYNAEFSTNDKGCQVTVFLEYELSGIKVLFSYDKAGKINGLWMNYFEIAGTTDEHSSDIKIRIGENSASNPSYELDGILRIPESAVNPPVVIMVQGSGQSDYDETIGPNKPFKDLAEGLAEKGIATIRYNKRYFQYPETAPANITIEDEVLNDVSYALEFVKNRKELENSRIYVLGHSLGGMLAPYIASRNPDIAGIIILAGSPRKLEDIILDQNKEALEAAADITDAEKEIMLETVQKEVDRIKALKPDSSDTEIMGIPSSYWLSLNKIDTAEICKTLSIPMLIAQGESDFQVSAVNDYKGWQDILRDNNNVTFKLYKGLNHLFMPTNGKTDVSEYNIKSSVDSQVIQDIADWIFQ